LTLIVVAMATSRLFALMPYALARDLGRRPFGVPAASGMIHLVGRVLRELHDAAQPQRVDTGVDQRLGQFGPLLGGAAAPYVA
jgi:hypothetical protein